MSVTTLIVTRGTAVTVFCTFTQPTRTSAKSGIGTVRQVAADPSTVKFIWKPAGGSETTWIYTPNSGPIAKLATGIYVATIPTSTVNANVQGKVVGTDPTAVGQFSIGVTVPEI